MNTTGHNERSAPFSQPQEQSSTEQIFSNGSCYHYYHSVPSDSSITTVDQNSSYNRKLSFFHSQSTSASIQISPYPYCAGWWILSSSILLLTSHMRCAKGNAGNNGRAYLVHGVLKPPVRCTHKTRFQDSRSRFPIQSFCKVLFPLSWNAEEADSSLSKSTEDSPPGWTTAHYEQRDLEVRVN